MLAGMLLYFSFVSPVGAQAQTETYTWNSVAIGGGGFVTGIIPSKTEQDLVYARTDVGGAYRLDAANDKWIPLLDWVSESELGYLGVESIAIDPVETNKVYMLVGTSYFNNGKSAILRSSDYGNTFSITDVTNQFKAHGNGMGRQSGEKLAIDPNSTNILFCGSRENGLFKSTDSGAQWSKVNSLTLPSATNGSNGISFVIIDASTGSVGSPSQTIIAGISATGSNLYRSDDGGATFTAISGAPTTLLPHRAVLASDRDLYITYTNNAGPWDIDAAGQIWKYNLQSGTWTNVTVSGFSGAYGGISVDPANPERLVASSLNTYQLQYADAYGDRIFLTTDGGSTWTDLVDRGFEMDPNGSPWINGHSIHWTGCVEFDPFDTKKAWVVSGNGIFKTDDIDASVNEWRFYVDGLEETVPLDIVSIPNGPVISVIGDYDGFRHTDVTQYAPIHTPRMGTTNGVAFASLDPKIMVRVGEEMYYSTDMGVSWTECTLGGEGGSSISAGNVAIAADGKIFLHSPQNSNSTYRSDNMGSSWTTVTGINGLRPVADPVNPLKFYAYNSTSGFMMVSTDGGVSFDQSASVGTGGSRVIRTAPGREGDVWVARYGTGLTRSTDSGQSFASIAGVTFCGAVGFGKAAPGASYPSVYIWGTVGGVLGIHRSTDEGETWKRVNDDAHEYGGPGNGQFIMGDMNVFGRVYMSTAGRGIVYGESDQTCTPDLVIPHIQVNTETAQQTSIVTVSSGNSVVFSPTPSSGGTWTWTGPQSFTSADREVTLSAISADQGGIYSAQFTNANGCESAPQTFAVSVVVKAIGITVRGQNDVSTIDENDGTLQMIAEFNPANTADQTVIWSTDNGDVASISASGLLTALSDGEVTVRATANDGSGVFGEAVITISNQNVTAVEKGIDSQFGIYPNPVSSELTIRNAATIKQVVVLDGNGKKIKQIKNHADSMKISFDHLPPGLYILDLKDVKNVRYNRRVVKE